MTHIAGAKGQVVLPKRVRERLGIRPGDRVTVDAVDGEARVSPAESSEPPLGMLAGDDALTGELEREHRAELESDARPSATRPSRVAIVSDTHLPRGRRRLPEGCLERLRTADLILHAGDFVSAEALAEVEALGPPVAAVHGNVDSEELRGRLPEIRMVEVDGVRIAMVHDAGPAKGRLRRMRRCFPDADALVFGHSHIPLHERDDDGFQIFNPGSPTDRRRQPRHTMGLVRVEAGQVVFELVELR